MQIRKEYHFHAAHRNEQLPGKCSNLHGHTYHVSLVFDVKRKGSISTLFADFDTAVDPLIEKMDHSTLLHQTDKEVVGLLADLNMKTYVLLHPSSVENLCFEIWRQLDIHAPHLQLAEIQLKETTSSTLIYRNEDYLTDRDTFNM